MFMKKFPNKKIIPVKYSKSRRNNSFSQKCLQIIPAAEILTKKIPAVQHPPGKKSWKLKKIPAAKKVQKKKFWAKRLQRQKFSVKDFKQFLDPKFL